MQELVRNAVRASSMSALADLLQAIAEKTNSYGCILWRLAPPRGGKGAQELFVVADWFSDNRFCANHSLSMETSFTGKAIRTGAQQLVPDISVIPDLDPFLAEAGITAFCSTPIKFADDVCGAVNIYLQDSTFYDSTMVGLVKELAEIVPALFQVIEDEVSFRLMNAVDGVLARVRHSVPDSESPFDHVQPAMTEVCDAVANALHCVETSVFLEDRFEAQGHYRLAGTTWEGLVVKQSYKASADDGVTGWSLAHPETPVTIFHLPDAAAIAREYKGMRWLDSFVIKDSLKGHPKIRDTERLPPLSYMSAPILDGKDVVGILRCSVGLGPVYFDERQHTILQRIASRIGPFWSGFLRNRSLEALVEKVGNLNSFADAELRSETPDERRILEEALRITQIVVPGAEITDVRLLNDDKTELRFAVPYGPKWNEGPREERERRRNRVYRLDEDPPKSVGAYVIQTRKTYVVKDTKTDPYYLENFPNTRRMIVAPLVLGTGPSADIYGVLDIRTSIDRDFPEFAIRMAELLASQLALYRKLAILIRDLNKNISDLEKLKDRQTQINEDLAHQLKSPTLAAHRRVNDLLRGMPDSELKTHLLRIRGVCARAMHVAANSWLFAKLARLETITPAKVAMDGEELLRMIKIMAFDASYIARGDEKNTFHVDGSGFSAVRSFQVDRGLLEQALTQLLDNAFKYGVRDKDAQVLVTGGSTRTGRIRISVTSEGVRLASSDISKCIERGWQSEEAKLVSDTGSGIGLWIVHHIMEAHRGSLEITPTDASGKTTFTLLFPEQ